MSDYVTKDELKVELQYAMRQQTDEILGVLNPFIQDVSDRFSTADKRLYSIEKRLDNVEAGIVDLKRSHDHLLNTIDNFIARIDHYETEQSARDNQFEKLLV